MLLTFEQAKARERLRDAESGLRAAEEVAGSECGVGIGLTLQNRIRQAERRVKAAKAALRKIDPNWSES